MPYLFLSGPSLFLVVAFSLGFVTPDYRPFQNTISELSLGKFGKFQTANFLISGLLILGIPLFVLTGDDFLTQRIAIGIWGGVLFLSGLFKTDPIDTRQATSSGTIHNILFLVGVPILLYAQFDTLRLGGFNTLGMLSLLCAVVSIPCFFWVVLGRKNRGLFQRILVCLTMLWTTIIAI